jgi:ribosomal protein S18 acetylase RimI-like enzyme
MEWGSGKSGARTPGGPQMERKVRLRKAVPDDALAIAKAHTASWRSAYRGLLPDERLERLDHVPGIGRFRETITNQSEIIYVAEDGNGIIGFLSLGPCRDPGADRATTGELYALYLIPEYWRKGIGRIMWYQAVRLLVSGGYSHAVLWVFEGNERARMFYEAMGFVADGTTKIVNLGAPANAVRYGKTV